MDSAQVTIESLQRDGPRIIAVGAVMMTCAFDAVLLRFLAKFHNVKHFGTDDVLIGLSMFSFFVTEVLVMRG